jgi:hypothetical protein
MKGQFNLTLTSPEMIEKYGPVIPLQFSTWSLKEFGKRHGLSYDELISLFAASKFSVDHIVNLILTAAEYVAKLNGKPFQFNDLDASLWVDDLGGPFSPRLLNELLPSLVQTLSTDAKEEPKAAGKKKQGG